MNRTGVGSVLDEANVIELDRVRERSGGQRAAVVAPPVSARLIAATSTSNSTAGDAASVRCDRGPRAASRRRARRASAKGPATQLRSTQAPSSVLDAAPSAERFARSARVAPRARPVAPASRVHVAAPNYIARRLVAGVVGVVVLIVLLAGLIGAVSFGAQAISSVVSGSPAAASADSGAAVDARDWVVFEAGDTMWTIAQAHHGTVDFDRYLDAVIDRNGTSKLPGEIVWLP